MRLLTSTAILGLLAAKAVAAPPQIITDFPVTGSLVQTVLGDLGEVQVLIGDGADPHHFQLRPSDAEALQSAGLLVWIGPEMTPWMQRAAENLTEGESLPLLAVQGTYLQQYGENHKHDHGESAEEDPHDHTEDEHAHDHGEGEHGDTHGKDAGHDHAEEGHDHAEEGHDHAEEGHDHAEEGHDHAEEGHDHAGEGHDHAEEGHDHGHSHDGTDPHAWLDPYNAQVWLKAIADELAASDPENAETYAANAEAGIAEIKEIDTQLQALLEPVKESSFVVFHDAYGYFTAHYGLQPAIAVSLGDATKPSAARLSEVTAKIAESGVTCAFPEFGHNEALVRNVIEGSNARIGDAIDPAGRGIQPGAGLYGDLLSNMGKALAGCLMEKG